MKKAPEGSLTISNSKGTAQYYHRIDPKKKNGVYIPKGEHKLIASLAQKDYDLKFLKVLQYQKNKISEIIDVVNNMNLQSIYENLSKERKELVRPHVLSDEQYVEQWLNKKYKGKSGYEDTLIFLTDRGEYVRSKAEKILADKFYSIGIPYLYEYPVNVKGYGIVYPDFILLNVNKRKEFYFEHFGMMDDEEYCIKTMMKIEAYGQSGIFPGKNLLVTFETQQRPLNMQVVEKMLKEFVLK